jgi:LytS/YehU family sensor histidine kinase
MTEPAKASPNVAKGVLGAILGALAGLPVGFVFYMVARAFLLSTDLWSSDAVMWAIIGATAAAFAYLAGSHGARPTRGGKIAVRSMTGFLIGALVTGPAVGALVGIIGGMMGVSQREGAFAMGVAFTIVPLAGLLGGIALAVFMGRRAARQGVSAGPAA